jgi:hypothetical protein
LKIRDARQRSSARQLSENLRLDSFLHLRNHLQMCILETDLAALASGLGPVCEFGEDNAANVAEWPQEAYCWRSQTRRCWAK